MVAVTFRNFLILMLARDPLNDTDFCVCLVVIGKRDDNRYKGGREGFKGGFRGSMQGLRGSWEGLRGW